LGKKKKLRQQGKTKKRLDGRGATSRAFRRKAVNCASFPHNEGEGGNRSCGRGRGGGGGGKVLIYTYLQKKRGGWRRRVKIQIWKKGKVTKVGGKGRGKFQKADKNKLSQTNAPRSNTRAPEKWKPGKCRKGVGIPSGVLRHSQE